MAAAAYVTHRSRTPHLPRRNPKTLPAAGPFRLPTTLAAREALRRIYGPHPDPLVQATDRRLAKWADDLRAGRPSPRKLDRVPATRQTVTQTADGRLSIAAYQVNLTDRQRERIRGHVLRIDAPAAKLVIHTVITGRRNERYWGAFGVDQQQDGHRTHRGRRHRHLRRRTHPKPTSRSRDRQLPTPTAPLVTSRHAIADTPAAEPLTSKLPTTAGSTPLGALIARKLDNHRAAARIAKLGCIC